MTPRHCGPTPKRGERYARSGQLHPQPGPNGSQDECLLHDARNLLGAIGLYCDLLSMPDVLDPEHRQYAEELRMLGARSGTLIERLLQSSLANGRSSAQLVTGPAWDGAASPAQNQEAADIDAKNSGTDATSATEPKPVNLQMIVERCSGLLSRVAGGRFIEVSYGDAASLPIAIEEEAVERILINLVRNAAGALSRAEHPDNTERDAIIGDGRGGVLQRGADATADDTPGAIRIGLGFVVNRTEDPRPWPIRRVRLTVEDSGCGMSEQQLERILCGDRNQSPDGHGIGFRVVRELVAASTGELRVMSALGIGTRVQIEWPVNSMTQGVVFEQCQEFQNREASSALTSAPRLPKQLLERRNLYSSQTSRRPARTNVSNFSADCQADKGRLRIC